MSAKNLDEYIAKVKAICDTRDNGSVIISTKHMIKILDIITTLKSVHHQDTIEIINQMIRDLDDTVSRVQ